MRGDTQCMPQKNSVELFMPLAYPATPALRVSASHDRHWPRALPGAGMRSTELGLSEVELLAWSYRAWGYPDEGRPKCGCCAWRDDRRRARWPRWCVQWCNGPLHQLRGGSPRQHGSIQMGAAVGARRRVVAPGEDGRKSSGECRLERLSIRWRPKNGGKRFSKRPGPRREALAGC
jgi:hypothetical protein